MRGMRPLEDVNAELTFTENKFWYFTLKMPEFFQ